MKTFTYVDNKRKTHIIFNSVFFITIVYWSCIFFQMKLLKQTSNCKNTKKFQVQSNALVLSKVDSNSLNAADWYRLNVLYNS